MPHLVYNASDSVPRGWYAIEPIDRPRVGEYVLVRLPGAVRRFAADRGYIPESVPLLKRVAALGGQRVCVADDTVVVDGVAVARTLARDGRGRPLPAARICRVLVDGEVFLLTTDAPASFDSRYFGPLDRSFLRGRATPLWTESRQR
jgi:conjugative transfer signal peptidase TraF